MRWFAASLTVILLGAGCVSLPFGEKPLDYNAEDLDMMLGSGFEIAQGAFSIGFGKDSALKKITVEEHQAGRYAVLSWTMDVERETPASKTAREYAMTHAPVGERAVIPEPVFEKVTEKGVVRTDGLGNAERLLLPTYWPADELSLMGEGNSIIWLSKQQYDELVATRSSHIQLGLFDSTLKDVIDFTDSAKSALARLQGRIADKPTTNKDFTKLTAKGDWGSYDLVIDGKPSRVKTIEASNAFASYTILANPENPIILRVRLLPWALGPDMFLSLRELKDVLGYSITSVSQSSADQPQH